MTKGGTTARSDIWGGAAWLVFGLLIVVASLRMERFESMGAQIYAMPGFVPGLLGGVVVLLGAALLFRGLRNRPQPALTKPAEPLVNRRIGITLLLTLVYAGFLIGRVPFWFATALFVTTFVVAFAPSEQTLMRRLFVAVVTGVLTSALVTYVFQYIFLVRLP
jgi:hypothetical protein